MTIKLKVPDLQELKPRITVIGVGGAGGNAVNNMIESGLTGVSFIAANTDAQALTMSAADVRIQLGVNTTEGLGAGSKPEVGSAAAEEAKDEIRTHLAGTHMVFIAAGMGGGTGTGAAPVIAKIAQEEGVLTVGVVTKPFHFEGARRMKLADEGVDQLKDHVDTLIVIPNQNLFRIANERTTFAESFKLADKVLHSGISCITDLMVKDGLINLDFADVKAIMDGMGTAVMGTGQASGDNRAVDAALEAITNPLLDDITLRGAKGLLISITGGDDLTLFDVDAAATRIREEVDAEAIVILGAAYDDSLSGQVRVSIVASGVERLNQGQRPETPLKHSLRTKLETAGAPQAPAAATPPPNPQQQPTPAMKVTVTPAKSVSNGQPDRSRAVGPLPQQTAVHASASSAVSQTANSAPPPPMQAPQRDGSPAQPQSRQATRVAPNPARPGTPPPVKTADGVKIEYGLPSLAPAASQANQPRDPAPRPDSPASEPGFAPAPPVRTPKRASRMPAASDFPPHVQQEMQADQNLQGPRGLNEHKKKAGFLERLTAVTKGKFLDDSHENAGDSAPEAGSSPQHVPQNSPPSITTEQPVHNTQVENHGPLNHEANQTHPGVDLRQGDSQDDESIEIPPFLRRKKG